MVELNLPASDPREVLRRLCQERGEDFAALSRLVGRNPAYIQQFIRRGTPRRLAETERRVLARHFGISEQLLGAEAPTVSDPGFMPVPALRRRGERSRGEAPVAFQRDWLATIAMARIDDLAMVSVEGDAMAPTLQPGDDLLVDRGDGRERLRDGLYVIRRDDRLLVKRLTLHPVRRQVTVQSDNPAHADWPGLALEEVDAVGRVVWIGRRLG